MEVNIIPIIILEGADCVGKTSLMDMIAKDNSYKVAKGSSFEISEKGANEMFKHMMNLLDDDNIIIDRFMYSNLVYGKLFDYPMMTDEQFDELVYKLDKKAMVVYLHAPKGSIEYRMNNRGDDMIKIDDIQNILNEYEKVMYGDFRPKFMITIDTSSSNFELSAKMISNIASLDDVKAYIDD